jgi:hypothetical protein
MSRLLLPIVIVIVLSSLSAQDGDEKKEAQGWVQVFPIEVEGGVQLTRAVDGKEYPTTGVGAASWFNRGGIGKWKVFIVQPESEMVVFILGDSYPG